MLPSVDVVRASSANLELQELLKKPTSELLGVSGPAAQALDKVGIKTIFDLGTSHLFAAARTVMNMSASGTASSRFGLLSNDLLGDTAHVATLEDAQSLESTSSAFFLRRRLQKLRRLWMCKS